MAWDDRTHKTITQARLMALSPALVYDELREYGRKLSTDILFPSDGSLETALLGRNEPLIDLALAQFGAEPKVVQHLYTRARAGTGNNTFDKAIRLGCLANEVLPNQLLQSGFKYFGDEELRRIALEGDNDEITALMTNSGAGKLLEELYLGWGPFKDVSSERRGDFVLRSIANPRLNRDDSDEHGPDLTAFGIEKGIYRLIQTAPLERRWVHILHALLIKLHPPRKWFAKDNPGEMFARWTTVTAQHERDGKTIDDEGHYTNLPLADELRCVMAAQLGLWGGAKPNYWAGSLDDPNFAMRCAFYGNARLTPEQMHSGRNRDGEAFVLAAVFNDNVYWDPKCREALEGFLRGPVRYIYKNRCDQIHARKESFDPRPISESGAALLDDIVETDMPSEEAQKLAVIEGKVSAVQADLRALARKVAWAFVILAVLLLFFRR